MIKLEARRALDIEVAAVTEGAVCADNNLLAAAGELDRRELFLVVFLECRAQLFDQTRLVEGQGLDICLRVDRSGLGLSRETNDYSGETHACSHVRKLRRKRVSTAHAMQTASGPDSGAGDAYLAGRGAFDEGGDDLLVRGHGWLAAGNAL